MVLTTRSWISQNKEEFPLWFSLVSHAKGLTQGMVSSLFSYCHAINKEYRDNVTYPTFLEAERMINTDKV